MVTGLASRVEGSCHSSGRHQIPVETSARRPGRSPPPEAAAHGGALALETQETPPSEGPGGWALGTLHTVILDVENPSSVT